MTGTSLKMVEEGQWTVFTLPSKWSAARSSCLCLLEPEANLLAHVDFVQNTYLQQAKKNRKPCTHGALKIRKI